MEVLVHCWSKNIFIVHVCLHGFIRDFDVCLMWAGHHFLLVHHLKPSYCYRRQVVKHTLVVFMTLISAFEIGLGGEE